MPTHDSSASVRVLRVFVSSPRDVAEARELVPEILERINVTDGSVSAYRLEAFLYERNVPPAIGPSAQESVDAGTPPYEIYLGIMAARFGTPTGDYGSGTEKEFRDAYARWQSTKQPHILLYFRDDVAPGRDPDAVKQHVKVREFRREIEPLGLVGSYNCLRGARTGFFEQVEQHLRMVAQMLLGRGGAPGLQQVAIVPSAPACVGRDETIATLIGTVLADAPAPVAVLGGPGIGKSTVTLAALNDPIVVRHFGAYRYFVRGDAAANAEALIGAIGQAMSLPPTPNVKPAVFIALRRGPSILVLDNAETPWEGDPGGTEDALAELAALPGLALVVSIRGTEVPPNLRWAARLHLPPLGLADARRAFLEISGQHFEGDPHLDDLCTAVEGVPLGLMLLACIAQAESDLSSLWSRWQRSKTDILKRAAGADRFSNLSLSLELSIAGPRMTDEARRHLAGLAVLPDGVARQDLEAVLGEAASETSSTLRRVGLAYEDTTGRLRLLAPIRDHAARSHPPDEETWWRIVEHYLRLAKHYVTQLGGYGGGAAIDRLSAEVANIEAAIALRLEAGDPRIAVDAAVAMAEFTRFSGLGSSLVLNAALATSRGLGDALGEVACIRSLADIAFARSDHDAARELYEQAMQLYHRVGDVGGEARCIVSLGEIALARFDLEAARERFEQALPLFRRVGNVLGEANCIQRLGDMALARSDHEAAHDRYENALSLFRRIGDIGGKAHCITGLGDVAARCNDASGALRSFEEALDLYARIPDPFSMATIHLRLAFVSGDRNTKRNHLRAARELWLSIDRTDLVERLQREFGNLAE